MSSAFRARVAEDPEQSLAAFDLSARERRRLETLAKDPRLRTGTMLHRANRLSMLSNTLPRTCRVLGPRGLKEMVQAYWSEHPPETQIYLREALSFADFLVARLRDGSLVNGFVKEVLETEVAMLHLGRAGGAWQPPAEPPSTAAPDACVLRLHPLCRVVRYRHDPDAVLQALDAKQAPDGLPEGEHWLLLTASGVGRVAMKSIPAGQGRALAACDGESSVEDLCTRTGLPAGLFEEMRAAGYLVG